jgi:hypothetical protein
MKKAADPARKRRGQWRRRVDEYPDGRPPIASHAWKQGGKLMIRLGASAIAISVALGFTTTSPALAASDIVDGPAVNWEVSLWGPPRAFTEALEVMKDKLAERTEGRIILRIYHGDPLDHPVVSVDGIDFPVFDQQAGFRNDFKGGDDIAVDDLYHFQLC